MKVGVSGIDTSLAPSSVPLVPSALSAWVHPKGFCSLQSGESLHLWKTSLFPTTPDLSHMLEHEVALCLSY